MTTEAALLRLTDRQRDVIHARDEAKLVWREVADVCQISQGYAQQLYKAAKKELAKWEATDEKDLYDPAKHLGKWSWKEPQPDQQTPPQAVSEPVVVIVAQDCKRDLTVKQSEMPDWGNSPMPEAAREIAQRKPTVAIATATTQPKVAWVTGVPMAVPRSKTPWSSVTIRA